MSARAIAGLGALLASLAFAQGLPNADTRLPGTGAGVAAPMPAPGSAQDPESAQPTLGDDKDVIAASKSWLKLLDEGKLGPAWDVSAPSLKSLVSRKDWIKGIGEARKPFGKVKSRTAERFARSHQLPGLPEGDYALLLFDTHFTNGKAAQEHVTWTLEKGEVWRVTGYFIR